MKDKCCRRHTELSSPANTADPIDDEIDIEREIASPILIARISDTELNGPNMTIVPREPIEVRFRVDHRFSASTFRMRGAVRRVLLKPIVSRVSTNPITGPRLRNHK